MSCSVVHLVSIGFLQLVFHRPSSGLICLAEALREHYGTVLAAPARCRPSQRRSTWPENIALYVFSIFFCGSGDGGGRGSSIFTSRGSRSGPRCPYPGRVHSRVHWHWMGRGRAARPAVGNPSGFWVGGAAVCASLQNVSGGRGTSRSQLLGGEPCS